MRGIVSFSWVALIVAGAACTQAASAQNFNFRINTAPAARPAAPNAAQAVYNPLGVWLLDRTCGLTRTSVTTTISVGPGGTLVVQQEFRPVAGSSGPKWSYHGTVVQDHNKLRFLPVAFDEKPADLPIQLAPKDVFFASADLLQAPAPAGCTDSGMRRTSPAQLQANAEREAHDAAIAAAPKADAKTAALVEKYVKQDSLGWFSNRYDVGSVHNVVMLPKGDDGASIAHGDYTFNGGSKGWVEVHFAGSGLRCIEFFDAKGCRSLREPDRKNARSCSELSLKNKPVTGAVATTYAVMDARDATLADIKCVDGQTDSRCRALIQDEVIKWCQVLANKSTDKVDADEAVERLKRRGISP